MYTGKIETIIFMVVIELLYSYCIVGFLVKTIINLFIYSVYRYYTLIPNLKF